MPQAIYTSPIPTNEPVKGYGKNSPERASLIAKYKEMYNQAPDSEGEYSFSVDLVMLKTITFMHVAHEKKWW